MCTCDYVQETKPNDFTSILKLMGTKRIWFSRDPRKLKAPVRIKRTDIFVECNRNANNLVYMCYRVLEHFGIQCIINIDLQ